MNPAFIYSPQPGSGDTSGSGNTTAQSNVATLTIPAFALKFPVVGHAANYVLTVGIGRSFDSPHYSLWITSNLQGMIISEELRNKSADRFSILVYVPANADWSNAGGGTGKPGLEGWVTLHGSARGTGLGTGGTIALSAVHAADLVEVSSGGSYY